VVAIFAFGSRGSPAVCRFRGGRARLNDRCSAEISRDLLDHRRRRPELEPIDPVAAIEPG